VNAAGYSVTGRVGAGFVGAVRREWARSIPQYRKSQW